VVGEAREVDRGAQVVQTVEEAGTEDVDTGGMPAEQPDGPTVDASLEAPQGTRPEASVSVPSAGGPSQMQGPDACEIDTVTSLGSGLVVGTTDF
ncbi:unnamed protein product, partial [Ectocarpus sp. 12 AP-2014]